LRKPLGYTPSVVVQSVPEEGFEFLAQLADSQDSDVLWIVRENLKKNRLVKNFPDQVASIKESLNKTSLAEGLCASIQSEAAD
jgi:hypothetical protein